MHGATLFKNFKERRVLNNNKQGMIVSIPIKTSCYLKGHCLIFLSAVYQLFIEYFNIK